MGRFDDHACLPWPCQYIGMQGTLPAKKLKARIIRVQDESIDAPFV